MQLRRGVLSADVAGIPGKPLVAVTAAVVATWPTSGGVVIGVTVLCGEILVFAVLLRLVRAEAGYLRARQALALLLSGTAGVAITAAASRRSTR